VKQKFLATLAGGEKGQLGGWIEIPFSVEEVFGTRARVPVKVSVNGFRFRSSMSPMGSGHHAIPVRRERCETAGVRPGQTVHVVLERDTAARIVRPPPALAKALSRNGRAQAGWRASSYTHKKEYADWIRGAVQKETQKRRLAKVIAALAAKQHGR
jgi:hypothetical protein